MSAFVGTAILRTTPDDARRAAAEEHLASLPDGAIWIWCDGSAEGGVAAGGNGALIDPPSGDSVELRAAAGKVCSSTRAELVAMRMALEAVRRREDDLPLVVCSDSQAALATLASGAGAQTTALGAALWDLLLELSAGGRRVHLQWVPAHCGPPGNETADRLAKEASSLPQDDVHVDVRTITRAVGRSASKAWRRSWNDSLFRRIIEDRMPNPVLNSGGSLRTGCQIRSKKVEMTR